MFLIVFIINPLMKYDIHSLWHTLHFEIDDVMCRTFLLLMLIKKIATMFINNCKHFLPQPFKPFIGVSTLWFPNMMFKPSWMPMKTNPTQMKLFARSTSFKGVKPHVKGNNCHEWHIDNQFLPLPIGSLVAHTRKQMILTCLCQKGMEHQKLKGPHFNHWSLSSNTSSLHLKM